MEKIYKSQDAAYRAAIAYQKKNGGELYIECTVEYCDENNHIIENVNAFVVAKGNDEDPIAESYEYFYYYL